ncbi:MAG: hypothetical protein AAFW66_05135, partial [Pseudomonadota bacterium]
DSHNGSGTLPDPAGENILPAEDVGPLNDSFDVTANDGIWDSLAPGDTVTFTALYTVTQQDIDSRQ